MGNPARFKKPKIKPFEMERGEVTTSTGKTFTIKYLSPDSLIPYERNTKIHDQAQIAKLKASIKEYDFDQPIVVDDEMVIIKGHGRHLAAMSLGMQKVPVIVRTDLTPQQVKAARIADNKISISTGMDDEMLMLEVEDLQQFGDDLDAFTEGFTAELIGFGEKELADLQAEIAARDAMAAAEQQDDADDKVPEVPKDAITKPGDVILMGKHRLVCGSSTDPDHLQLLLGDETVDQLVTDPPYGVDYKDKQKFMRRAQEKYEREAKDIKNDAIEDYHQFFTEFLSIIPFSEKNNIHIAMASTQLHHLCNAMEDCGIVFNDILVWLKNAPVPCRKDHNSSHELVVFGWKGSHEFFGGMDQTTIYKHDRPKKNDIHPTMKPIGLFTEFIKEGSKAGAIVYDAFGGSGTTLIACEQTGRQARLMELSPNYCDVIVSRWETLTGKKSERLSSEEWEARRGD